MKKISLVSAIALAAVSLVGISPAQASSTETIAIIDTQFEGANVGTNVTHVCVTACNINPIPKSNNAVQIGHYNHGIEMAEIIRKSNPNAHLVLIRAGSTRVGPVSSAGLNDALRWIADNGKSAGVSVVSISLNAGVNNCSATSPTFRTVKPLIDAINTTGIKVLAASGNIGDRLRSDQLAFPACVSGFIPVAQGIKGLPGTTAPSTVFLAVGNGTNFNLSTRKVSWRSSSALTAMVAASFNKLGFSSLVAQKVTLDVVN
jgi:hypothetical protein